MMAWLQALQTTSPIRRTAHKLSSSQRLSASSVFSEHTQPGNVKISPEDTKLSTCLLFDSTQYNHDDERTAVDTKATSNVKTTMVTMATGMIPETPEKMQTKEEKTGTGDMSMDLEAGGHSRHSVGTLNRANIHKDFSASQVAEKHVCYCTEHTDIQVLQSDVETNNNKKNIYARNSDCKTASRSHANTDRHRNASDATDGLRRRGAQISERENIKLDSSGLSIHNTDTTDLLSKRKRIRSCRPHGISAQGSAEDCIPDDLCSGNNYHGNRYSAWSDENKTHTYTRTHRNEPSSGSSHRNVYPSKKGSDVCDARLISAVESRSHLLESRSDNMSNSQCTLSGPRLSKHNTASQNMAFRDVELKINAPLSSQFELAKNKDVSVSEKASEWDEGNKVIPSNQNAAGMSLDKSAIIFSSEKADLKSTESPSRLLPLHRVTHRNSSSYSSGSVTMVSTENNQKQAKNHIRSEIPSAGRSNSIDTATNLDRKQRDLQTVCFVLSFLSVSKCRDIEGQVVLLRERLRYQTILSEYLVRKMKLLNVEMRRQSQACEQLNQSQQEQESHMTQYAQDTYRLLRKQQQINQQLLSCVQDLKSKHSIKNIMLETAAVMSTMYLVSIVTSSVLHFIMAAMKKRKFSTASVRLKQLMKYTMALQGVLVVKVISRGTVSICKRLLSWMPGAVIFKNWFRKVPMQAIHLSS